MEDYNLKEAERIGNEADEFASWVDSNDEGLIEQYRDSITIDDVPEGFIETKYQQYLEDEGD